MELPKFAEDQTPAIDNQILEAIQGHVEQLARRSISLKAVSQKSLATLATLDEVKKRSILDRLEKMSYLSFHEVSGIPEVEDPEQHPERRLVERALSFYGLELRDENFWKNVKFDDVIELYNEDGNQVFRTLNFFKTCGYSLLDLLTHEWYVLWERPKFVMNSMFESANKVFSGEYTSSNPMNVPQHIVKEVFNGTDALDFAPRSALINFGVICPVFDSEGRPAGFLINCSARLQTIGEEETRKVRII